MRRPPKKKAISSENFGVIGVSFALLTTVFTGAMVAPQCFATDLQPAHNENAHFQKLVQQITVDALRGDLPNRYQDHQASPWLKSLQPTRNK